MLEINNRPMSGLPAMAAREVDSALSCGEA